jgi:hypothetical protein
MGKEEDSVLEDRLWTAFKPSDGNCRSDLFRAINLVLCRDEKVSGVYDAYKLLGVENFVRLIHLFDGRTVRFPTSTDLKDAIILSLCFYYREVEGLAWDEIHDRIPFRFNSLSVTHKIKSLNSVLKSELSGMLRGQFGSGEIESER